MGTITSRKRKDNSTAYTAQIRINRDGKTVYQESQAFDRKQVAQAWIERRETELAQPDGIERQSRKSVTQRDQDCLRNDLVTADVRVSVLLGITALAACFIAPYALI